MSTDDSVTWEPDDPDEGSHWPEVSGEKQADGYSIALMAISRILDGMELRGDLNRGDVMALLSDLIDWYDPESIAPIPPDGYWADPL